MQPTILDFLESYLKWVHDGAPYRMPFDPTMGLCSNAAIFGLDYWSMANQFDTVIPFNIDEDEYSYESKRKSHHLNPKRIQWVKDKILELKNEESKHP